MTVGLLVTDMWLSQWKEVAGGQLMDSKLKCVFEMPTQDEAVIQQVRSSSQAFYTKWIIDWLTIDASLRFLCSVDELNVSFEIY